MNERGVVMLDSILALAIVMLICLSILPYASFLSTEVIYAKQMLHASEVALIGTSFVAKEDREAGHHVIDSVTYYWHYKPGEICVDFKSVKGDELYCVQANQIMQ